MRIKKSLSATKRQALLCRVRESGYQIWKHSEKLSGIKKSGDNAISGDRSSSGSAGGRGACFCKNKRAAAGLTGQITSGSVTKEYLAVTDQKPENVQGHLEDYLKKDGKTNTSAVVTSKTDRAKKAVLDYEVLNEVSDERTSTGKRILVRIQLGTGRHHQIRVQMAHAGMPLLGDRKYNPEDSSGLPLGLCSCHLVFRHPVTGKKLEFQVTPKGECFADFPNI